MGVCKRICVCSGVCTGIGVCRYVSMVECERVYVYARCYLCGLMLDLYVLTTFEVISGHALAIHTYGSFTLMSNGRPASPPNIALTQIIMTLSQPVLALS